MDRRRRLGVFSIILGLLLFAAMGIGLVRAVRGADASGFFLTPFLLMGALVCLGVGFEQLWGQRPSAEPPSTSSDAPTPSSGNGGPPRS